MQCLQQACAVFLCNNAANHQMPVPIYSCLHLPHPPIQVTTKEWKRLQFILILAHLFPVNLNINWYYAIGIVLN
jgi:hypothetical protein